MEPWELEILEIKQPPAFGLDNERRREFHAAEEAVNARLAKPPETHLHHDHEIAQPAILTRHRISSTYDGPMQHRLN